MDSRKPENSESVGPSTPSLARDKGGIPPGEPGSREAHMVAEAKEKFRLLTLQTLKYSSVWLIVQVRFIILEQKYWFLRNPTDFV